jgi:hypothetical protein
MDAVLVSWTAVSQAGSAMPPSGYGAGAYGSGGYGGSGPAAPSGYGSGTYGAGPYGGGSAAVVGDGLYALVAWTVVQEPI